MKNERQIRKICDGQSSMKLSKLPAAAACEVTANLSFVRVTLSCCRDNRICSFCVVCSVIFISFNRLSISATLSAIFHNAKTRILTVEVKASKKTPTIIEFLSDGQF